MTQQKKSASTASLIAYARLFAHKRALSGFVLLLTTLGTLMDGLSLLMRALGDDIYIPANTATRRETVDQHPRPLQ